MVDFCAIINDFLTAELGEEFRDSLVAIAEALQTAINSQLQTVTDDLTDEDATAAPTARAIASLLYAGRDQEDNIPRIMTWYDDAASLSSVADMPSWSVIMVNGARAKELVGSGFIGYDALIDNVSYVIEKRAMGKNQTTFLYCVHSLAYGSTWYGYALTSGGTVGSILWYDNIETLIYAGRSKTTNELRCPVWHQVTVPDKTTKPDEYAAFVATFFADLPDWSRTTASGATLKDALDGGSFPDPEHLINSTTYVVEKTSILRTSKAYLYQIFSLGRGRIWSGYQLANSSTISWYKTHQPTDTTLSVDGVPADAGAVGRALSGRSVKILIFGNSYSYSDLGLLPAVLTKLGIGSTVGICYISGGKIADHLAKWDQDGKYAMYSECDGQTWTNTANAFTAKDALAVNQWDYIVFQAAGAIDTTAAYGLERMEVFANRITEHVTYPVCFLYNFSHMSCLNAAGASQTVANYETTAAKVQVFVGGDASNPSSFITDAIPCATAIQNARELDTFKAIGDGDYTYLSHDDVGHLKNGSGPLISSFVAALKVCQLLGAPLRTFGMQLFPTDSFLATYNLWTRTSHGASDISTATAEDEADAKTKLLLAAKCATAAIKAPYVITDVNTDTLTATEVPEV